MSAKIPAKDRMKVSRQRMPTAKKETRCASFEEVNLGFDVALAKEEAFRCLRCSHSACTQGCPVGVKVKDFVELIERGHYLDAYRKIREDNVLPSITARVCPQETQCEGACILGKKFSPLAIGHLERFVSDYAVAHKDPTFFETAAPTQKRVAIVGSGPAGLAAAGDLTKLGHTAIVFEALHEIGGVLTYGIPSFRLPKDVVAREVDNLRRMGVQFETDVVVGKTVSIDDLLEREGCDAVFIATGAGLPRFLGIPGEHLMGVCSANEFLTRVNLMKAHLFPEYDQPVQECYQKEVAVIGGGNTAVDAARTAVRLGAQTVHLVYRRSQHELPARREEVQHAKEEGVSLRTLASPTAFLGDNKGWLRAMRVQSMKLGEPDASGRARPVPVQDGETETSVDMAVIAIGTHVNPIIQSSTQDLAINPRGHITADETTLQTSKAGVFAGGDVVTGTATVIQAMAQGRRAAQGIHAYLTKT